MSSLHLRLSLVFLFLLSLANSEPLFFGRRTKKPRRPSYYCRPYIQYETVYHTEHIQVPEYKTIYETKYQPTTHYQDIYKTVDQTQYSTIYQHEYITTVKYQTIVSSKPVYSTVYKTINQPVYVTTTQKIPNYITETDYQIQYKTEIEYSTLYTTTIQQRYVTTTYSTTYYNTVTHTQYNNQYVTVTKPQPTFVTNYAEPEEHFTFSFFEPEQSGQSYVDHSIPPILDKNLPYFFDSTPEPEYEDIASLSTSYDSFTPSLNENQGYQKPKNIPSPPYYVPAIAYNSVLLPGYQNSPNELDDYEQRSSLYGPSKDQFEESENLPQYGYESQPPIYQPPKPEDQLPYLLPPSQYESFISTPGSFQSFARIKKSPIKITDTIIAENKIRIKSQQIKNVHVTQASLKLQYILNENNANTQSITIIPAKKKSSLKTI